MSSMNSDLGDTLAQVNVVREAMGYPALYELPDARTGQSTSCLFYRALSDVGCQGVGSSGIKWSSERQAELVAELWGVERLGAEVRSPHQIRRVVNRFDNHGLKHYETID